jgi:hypothetical protein
MTHSTSTHVHESDPPRSMASIANLIHDDPYLSMPKEERIALRKQRRVKLRSVPIPPPPPIVLVTSEPVAELPPIKDPWFHIVEEIDPPQRTYPALAKILRVVAAYYSITVDDLISARRTKDLILPRHMGMYLSRVLTLRSHSYISARFGGRDHTVSVFASRKINDLLKSDWLVAFDAAHLEAAIV